MKPFANLLLILSICIAIPVQAQKHKITSAGKAYYSIIIDRDSDSLTQFAADELQDYLFKITNTRVKISNRPAARYKSIFLGKEWFTKKAQYEQLERLNNDGFCIFSEDSHFYLGGKQPLGTVYAVYTLLQDYAGCLWFGNDEIFVPENEALALPDIALFTQPDFSFRHPAFPDRNKQEYYLPTRTNPQDDWGMFVHTFHRLMPPDRYFDRHPEYYSLVNGKRIRDGQLCLGNPEVIRILTENLREEMAKKPECTYWSVSQNDCINYCECDHCQELYDKYGSFSGAYVHMANQIARQFPDKQISTLAYQFTRSAPTAIVPDSNVNIMFCSIECNRSRPLAVDPRSADFVKDMKDWTKLTRNIIIWDYVVQFKTFTCPFPNFRVIQPNIRLFREHSIPMMFQQGSGISWSDFYEYKQALIARLLWDVDLDEPAFRKHFFNLFYGAAAPVMLDYFDLVHDEMDKQADDRDLDIYGFPVLYSSWFLKPELLKRYSAMMDRAEALVADDPVRHKRVLRQRSTIDFAMADIALNLNSPELSFFQTENGRKIIDPEMEALLGRFVSNCKATGIRSIDENRYAPEIYRDQAMSIANMAVRANKAAGKKIVSLTPYSPKLDVGGEKALTDRRFGGQHFRLNWLGYQANDMEVLIDFEKPETFSRVETNFFLDLVSWIFLPLEVRIEVSDDGKAFRTVYDEKIPEPERSFGQKPVHFSFSFPETTARYMKVTAVSYKYCPAWHRGANQPAWICIDELVVE